MQKRKRMYRHATPHRVVKCYLRKYRVEANMTQFKLAVKAKVSPPSISNYERGQKPLTESIKQRIASVLGVAVEAIWPG